MNKEIKFADEYEKEMYEKIISGTKLSRGELIELREFSVDEIEGGDRRWSRTIETICQLGNKYFLLEWEQGLTEMQDNEFYNQPCEVILEERIVTKIEKVWSKV